MSTEPLYSNDCQGVKIDRDESQWRFCNGLCQKQLPDHHFIEEMVTDWKQRDSELEARCARCVFQIFRVLCTAARWMHVLVRSNMCRCRWTAFVSWWCTAAGEGTLCSVSKTKNIKKRHIGSDKNMHPSRSCRIKPPRFVVCLRHFGAILRPSRGILEAAWGIFGVSWERSGSSWGHL